MKLQQKHGDIRIPFRRLDRFGSGVISMRDAEKVIRELRLDLPRKAVTNTGVEPTDPPHLPWLFWRMRHQIREVSGSVNRSG